MQLRRSPGGRMLKSFRSRPLDPPSSVTVTTAARSLIRHGSQSGTASASAGLLPGGDATKWRKPRRMVERPVPPPIATTRNDTGAAVGVAAASVVGTNSAWDGSNAGTGAAGDFTESQDIGVR